MSLFCPASSEPAPLIWVPSTSISSLLVSEEAVAWAIRLFIGREPVDESEIAFHQQHPDIESLWQGFAQCGEFKRFYRELVHDGSHRYRMPLFLLELAADPKVLVRFDLPTFERPVSQLCADKQFAEPAYLA